MTQTQRQFVIRSQRYFDTAAQHVAAVRADTEPPTEANKERRRIYGNLCHAFPVMVRSNGLCQALAFVAAKAATGDPERPTTSSPCWASRET
jgi:CRISPR type III-B/RAMP module-associated protein Cmr5